MEKIYVISDGTGRTAEQILQAALTQFPDAPVEIIVKPEIRSEQQLDDIISEVADNHGLIAHTLVTHQLREYMIKISRAHNIEYIDLMGPLLVRLSHRFANSPAEEPGLFHRLNKEYFKRIDAMQFAFSHDDGQRFYEYEKAEIVLVGVSRTFKTPLSIYLAFKGWFVANYPIVLGIEPPEILGQLSSGHVFGLMTQANDLSTLRSVRQEFLGGNTNHYSSLEYVKNELNYSQSIFNKYQWPVITVTDKPIEEIASEILSIRRNIHPPVHHL
ncbi:MAG: pyruvate, water dikinase regulatory protein [Bacteroidota bacterium]|nr:pyruvate, water dikinase regulatory protein [Bacteroidota bacterium]